MTYRILLVDDEPLARERLKRLLQPFDAFCVAGEAAHGDAALDWLQQQPADLVLLDIQMPGRNGLETAAAMQQLPQPPLLVFCTAYDEHALQAFAVKAIDYLLKPVRPEDLARALQRAQEWLQQRPAPVPAAARNHLTARTYHGLQLIPLDDILYCQADQKYVTVVHDQGETLIDESLKQLEEEFPTRFVRAHRSTLVALDRIERLETLTAGGHQLVLRGHAQGIPVSRRHLSEVRQLLRRL
ncbi:response regulator [Oceanospirillaceae bacterium ASx5O]|nr:response regulator [Oceanospirillaceae bacterium ASx5O]